MKKEDKTISKGQFLCDIMDQIPSNTIIFKTVTGIGATTLELEFERNSIIIEPNVPVIKGKKAKGRLGVYEGVNVRDIMDYLINPKMVFKKILTTPESFPKVLKAMDNLNINIYEDYFLLFDECDRTTKDVNFRETIIFPLEHFFSFRNKAFVSATAVIPSDPRFDEHNFKILVIKPDYDYKENIELVITNNVFLSFSEVLMANKSECVCIFLSSIIGINQLINRLGIKDESYVYCSRQSKTELTALDSDRVHENLTKTFAKFNFFTCRFNSAVDILMNVKPDVIMVTNLDVANHTMIDPDSDAVQIKGRFRNGTANITVISNFDNELNVKTEEQSDNYLNACEECFNLVKSLRNATNVPEALEALNEALELLPYFPFLNKDGSKNHFMRDNFKYEEKVKSLFQSADVLIAGYQNNYFLPTIKTRIYKYSDSEEPIKSTGSVIREMTKMVIKALKKLNVKNENMYYLDNSDYIYEQLKFRFPYIVEAYNILGEQDLLYNAYSKGMIEKAVKNKKIDSAKSNFPFIKKLQIEFPGGYKAPGKVMTERFKAIIRKYNLELKGTMKELGDYFNISNRTTVSKEGEKGFIIISSKFSNK